MTPNADYVGYLATRDVWLESCEHEYTANTSGSHAWCQKCDSVISLLPPNDSSGAVER
jgi:hypothetical protein